MKLKEILETYGLSKHDDRDKSVGGFHIIKDAILEAEEFYNCNVSMMDSTEFMNSTEEFSTILVNDNTKFHGNVILGAINLTERTQKMPNITELFENEAIITPILYDPMTFVPRKIIALRWSPEIIQDAKMRFISGNEIVDFRDNMHSLLDDVLDDMEKYMLFNPRSVLITGKWDRVTN